jgi:seryl-tRNA synthetase
VICLIDPRVIRENPSVVRKNLEMRKDSVIIQRFDSWLSSDKEWRELKQKTDDLRSKRNTITESIKQAKMKGEDTTSLMTQAKSLPDEIKASEAKLKELEEKNKELIMRIPNMLHESVPYGKDDTENVMAKTWGEVAKNPNLIHHGELAKKLGVADFDRAVKIAGEGFYYLKGDLAMLDLALQRLALDILIEKGFTPIQPPLMMNRKAYSGVTDLGDFETVMYKIDGVDNYMIATSEHPMVSMYMDEVFEEKDLETPIRFAGMSPCFRKEIGKHGLDERGFFRVHQFNKIEQVILCKPEDSWKEFDSISKNQETFFQKLEIPYRVVNVCTGDMGVVAAKKYDLECWSPREGKYIELGSCSNCTAYQSVRLNIKYKKSDGTREYVHTLNNTMVPTTRTLRVLIETYQTPEGTIRIPKALQQYMNGKTEIKMLK